VLICNAPGIFIWARDFIFNPRFLIKGKDKLKWPHSKSHYGHDVRYHYEKDDLRPPNVCLKLSWFGIPISFERQTYGEACGWRVA
jgi:hypothetical protein